MEIDRISRKINRKVKQKLKNVDLEVKNQNSSVTDHAVIRYLERILNIDTAIIRQIITDGLDAKIASANKGFFKSSHGFKIITKNHTVLTVI